MSFRQQTLTGRNVNIAFMTSGGLAPCLSSSLAQLVREWNAVLQSGQITGLTIRVYKAGYKGLLTGDSVVVPEAEWALFDKLNYMGGSAIGNSRVKVRSSPAFVTEFRPEFDDRMPMRTPSLQFTSVDSLTDC